MTQALKFINPDDMQARKLQNGKTADFLVYLRHIDRETARRLGCEVQHSNANINSELTLQNESYYKDSS